MKLVLFICLLQISGIAISAELRIATAANFYPTLKKIKLAYEETGNDTITIIRGSTGKLYAQILQGAPFDMFFSADSKRADKLVNKGKSYDDKSYVYAIGQLALWKPDVDSWQALKEKLESRKFNKLAIANPKTAPYGKAAIEALKAMELYEEVKSKLVYGENISQTLQFVQSGAADLGFVARSHVMHDMYWEVDPYLHTPIKQKMIVIKHSKQAGAANKFYKFMQTAAAKNIIKADGYLQ